MSDNKDGSPPGGVAADKNAAGDKAAAASSSSSATPSIEDHLDADALARKLNPSAPAGNKGSGYLQAKIDSHKPILHALLSECPSVLQGFLPYDAGFEASLTVSKKWYRSDKGTYTVSLLPSQSEIDSSDLGALYKMIMAFVKERLGVREQKGNVFGEKVTSSSIVVACVMYTTLVKLFNGAQGADLIHKLTAYQSFIATMQSHLLDKYDADSKIAKSLKSARGRSNDPTGQSAFACLNQCSTAAEKKKKEVRHRCFKEALPRVDGIHATLSAIRKRLSLLFLRVHHNMQIPLDFDYILDGDPDQSVEKPSPLFMPNQDFPIGMSPEAGHLLRAIKRDGLFHELYNVATQQLATALDQPSANEAIEFTLDAQSVLEQTKAITYSNLLGESGLLRKLALAEQCLEEQDQTPLLYPLLMSELEHAPAHFLSSVIMRKMTADLFMAQIQLANLTPIVASEAMDAYTLALAEFGTSLRDFVTRLTAARDHIASMHRFGFELKFAGTTLLASMINGEGKEAASGSADPNDTSYDPATATHDAISPEGVQQLLHYWERLRSFRSDKHSLRYLNELGKLCEELQQHVDALFEHIKLLRNSTDVVKSYAMMEQAISDLRKFNNCVVNATGKQLQVHDQPLQYFKELLHNQAAIVTANRSALRDVNHISLALQAPGIGAGAASASAVAARASPHMVMADGPGIPSPEQYHGAQPFFYHDPAALEQHQLPHMHADAYYQHDAAAAAAAYPVEGQPNWTPGNPSPRFEYSQQRSRVGSVPEEGGEVRRAETLPVASRGSASTAGRPEMSRSASLNVTAPSRMQSSNGKPAAGLARAPSLDGASSVRPSARVAPRRDDALPEVSVSQSHLQLYDGYLDSFQAPPSPGRDGRGEVPYLPPWEGESREASPTRGREASVSAQPQHSTLMRNQHGPGRPSQAPSHGREPSRSQQPAPRAAPHTYNSFISTTPGAHHQAHTVDRRHSMEPSRQQPSTLSRSTVPGEQFGEPSVSARQQQQHQHVQHKIIPMVQQY